MLRGQHCGATWRRLHHLAALLETGDPDRVYDEVQHLLRQVRAERTTAAAPATAA
ncbi:hypothetical protein ACFXJ5_27325 [Streptomyces sp. NPDC059373]